MAALVVGFLVLCGRAEMFEYGSWNINDDAESYELFAEARCYPFRELKLN